MSQELGCCHWEGYSMDDGEMAMNIFIPEYVVLAVILLFVVYHLMKTPNTNDESGESPVKNDKRKRLH